MLVAWRRGITGIRYLGSMVELTEISALGLYKTTALTFVHLREVVQSKESKPVNKSGLEGSC